MSKTITEAGTRFGIEAKIWATIAIFGGGYIILLVLLQWTSLQAQKHMTLASGSLFPAALSSQEAIAGFQKASKRYHDAVLMLDKKTLASADDDAQSVLSALRATEEDTKFSPGRREQIAALAERYSDIRSRSKSLYSDMIQHPDDMTERTQQAIASLALGNREMEASLAALRKGIADDFQAELAVVTKWSKRQRTFGIVVLFVALAAGIFASTLLSRGICTAVGSVLVLAEGIAAGDLTHDDLIVQSRDELGELTAAINKMSASLRHTIHAITESAMQVATASEKLEATSKHISAHSQETSERASVVSNAAQNVSQNLQTVATSAEEMGASIREIARSAGEATAVVVSAVKDAENSNSIVSKLAESSRQIGEVIKEISWIAQQTNLLALNATIEASRAGEAGKAFAVVAHEVKELAGRTAKATEDINREINAIQADSRAAAEAIGSVTGIIHQVNDISTTIATAVEQQDATTNEMSRNVADAARGSGEITSNILSVAKVAEGTSRDASDTRTAAQELVQMSAQLRDLVAQFRVKLNENSVR